MINKSYHSHFTDSNDRIQICERLECPNDVTAVLKVEELLAASKYKTAELWQSARLVGKWSANPAGTT